MSTVTVPANEVPKVSKVNVDTPATGDVTVASTEEDEQSIMLKAIKQIEFYFADSNLPYDRFMWNLHTANPEHWVPLLTVASFKRMQPYKTKGLPWIADALRTHSEDLEVDESGENIRRKREVQEPKGVWERTIYAKGFGKEEPGMQTKLEDFFNKYGKVNAVRMRRIDGKKEFKGSVFVEFSDFENVEAFLNADPKPSWEGEDLLTMTKEAYCNMKIVEKGLTGKAAELRKVNDYSSPYGRGKSFNAFREMASKTKKPKPEIYLQFMGSKLLIHEDENGQGYVKTEEVPHSKGATLKFEGWEGEVMYRDVKEALKEHFTRNPYINHEKGQSSGLLGFDKALSEEDITFVKDTLKGKGGDSVVWSVAGEEEEKAFQIERANHAARTVFANSQQNSRGGGRGGGRRGGDRRGGRGGHRGGSNRGGSSNNNNNNDKSQSEKRKRGVEPDGGSEVGVRGQGVPVIVSSKKLKVDGDVDAGGS